MGIAKGGDTKPPRAQVGLKIKILQHGGLNVRWEFFQFIMHTMTEDVKGKINEVLFLENLKRMFWVKIIFHTCIDCLT